MDLSLPNTLNISFKGLQASIFLSEIENKVAVSAGAACHSGKLKISYVLEAMDIPEEWAMGAIRFSIGKMTTKKEIKDTIFIVSNAISKLI